MMSLYSRPYNGWYGCVIRKVSPVPAVLTVVDRVLQRAERADRSVVAHHDASSSVVVQGSGIGQTQRHGGFSQRARQDAKPGWRQLSATGMCRAGCRKVSEFGQQTHLAPCF